MRGSYIIVIGTRQKECIIQPAVQKGVVMVKVVGDHGPRPASWDDLLGEDSNLIKMAASIYTESKKVPEGWFFKSSKNVVELLGVRELPE